MKCGRSRRALLRHGSGYYLVKNRVKERGSSKSGQRGGWGRVGRGRAVERQAMV
jgi:hypothetical protein